MKKLVFLYEYYTYYVKAFCWGSLLFVAMTLCLPFLLLRQDILEGIMETIDRKQEETDEMRKYFTQRAQELGLWCENDYSES